MKNTQGKWTPFDNEKGDITIQSDNGELIGCVWEAPDDESMRANAKLIASAPKLLEALEKIRNSIKNQNLEARFGHTFTRVEQAIKKATS